MRTHLLRPLAGLALLLGALAAPRTAAAQKALIYCPPSDPSGCEAIAASLAGAPAFPAGVDKAYDGTLGTVDLKTADLNAYAAFVVPSLSDDASPSPYALLRDSSVVARLKNALLGRRALWSGSPDQGSTNHDMKEALVRNLASWAAGNFASANGPGLVVLRDATADDARRYSWLRTILGVNVTADPKVVSYASVRGLTSAATEILTFNGSPIAYTNMASYGFQLPSGAANVSLDAVGQTGTTDGGQVVLVTMQGANTGGALVQTDKDDYAPGTTVVITGSGFGANEIVRMTLHEDPLVHEDRVVVDTTDANGAFINTSFAPEQHDLGVRFVLTAVGQTSGDRAQTTFTDGPGDFNVKMGTTGATFTLTWKVFTDAACTTALSPATGGTRSVGATGGTDFSTTLAAGRFLQLQAGAASNGGTFTSWSISSGPAAPSSTANPVCLPRDNNTINVVAVYATSAQTTLAVSPASGSYGGSAALSATLTSNGAGVSGKSIAFTLNGAAAGSATTNAQGVATIASASLAGIGGGSYPAGVAASFAGDGSFGASSGTAALTVGQASQTITFLPLADKLTTDGTFAVSATASSGLPVSFSAAGKCTVSGAQVTLGQGAGSCTITASQAGNANYAAAASLSQSFNIAAVTPVITWANPAPITYGTALGATQLNATAGGVPGTFAYAPAAGVKLNAGAAQTLSVTFTPTDLTTYTTATKSVTIDVTQAAQTITFDALPNRTYGDAPFTVSATSSAGLTVSFAVGATDACTIAGTTVTLAKAGSCTVTATQAGDGNTAAAQPVARTFTIGTAQPVFSALSAPQITYGDASVTVGGKLLAGSLAPQDGPVTIVVGTGGSAMSKTGSIAADGTFSASFDTPTLAANDAGYPIALSYSSPSGNFAPASDNSLTLVVKKRAATLTLGNLAQAYDGTPKSVSVTSNPAGVTTAVTYDGGATAPTNAGSYAVAATVTDGNYVGSASGTLVISKASQSITFGTLGDKKFGDAAFSVSATGGASGNAVTFAAKDGSKCSVSGTTVTILGAGSCTIVASQPGNANYDAAEPVERAFTIGKAAATIAVSGYTGTYDGQPHGATGTATGIGGASLTNLLTLGDSFTNVPGGTATWAFAGNDDYEAAGGSVAIAISKATPTVSVDWSGGTFGAVAAATASVTGIGGADLGAPTLLYEGVSPTVYAASATAPTNAGTYKLTASFTGNTNYGAGSATATATIARAASTTVVTVSDAEYSGAPHGGTASVTGVGGLNESVAVTYEGRNGTTYAASATAPTNAGDYTARATYAGGANHLGSSDSKNFSIAKASSMVSLECPASPLPYTGAAQTPCTATATGAGGLNVAVTPSYANNVNAGDVTVTAAFAGDANHTGSEKSGGFTIAKATATIAVTGYTGTYDGQPHGATGTATGVTGEDLASLLNLGSTFTDAPGGTASWSFAGNGNYEPASGTAAIVINKATPIVTAVGGTFTYDGVAKAGSGSATGVGGAPLTPVALSYEKGGVAFEGTPTDAGTYTLKATYAGSANYEPKSGTATIQIDRATPTVNVSWTGGKFGASNAASGSVIGVGNANLGTPTFLYEGVSPTVYAASSTAPTNAGSYKVTASFDGNTNYTEASNTATTTIEKATPTVSWPTPAAVPQGTALSTTQLNATLVGVGGASVNGASTYTPASGTKLVNAGPNALAVSFTSSDPNYFGATGGTTIQVTNVGPIVNTITLNAAPVPVGSTVSMTATFSDPGINDKFDATIEWEAGNTTGVVSYDKSTGNGTVSGSYKFTQAGVYTVKVTVTDGNGGTGTRSSTQELIAYVVVYDTNGGFVTGGGWIDSPSGACKLAGCTDATIGKANFGFVSKYQKGASLPTGNTEFQFKAGNLNFNSSVYEWLVVGGARAQYKGRGTINGQGDYGFLISAVDNGSGGTTDAFRIKIWERSSGTVVYDNQMNQPEDSAAATTLGGGNITVQTK